MWTLHFLVRQRQRPSFKSMFECRDAWFWFRDKLNCFINGSIKWGKLHQWYENIDALSFIIMRSRQTNDKVLLP